MYITKLYSDTRSQNLFLQTYDDVDTNAIIDAWKFYMKQEDNSVLQKEFIENMEKKISDQDFLGDMKGLLRPGLSYEIIEAYEFVKKELLEKI